MCGERGRDWLRLYRRVAITEVGTALSVVLLLVASFAYLSAERLLPGISDPIPFVVSVITVASASMLVMARSGVRVERRRLQVLDMMAKEMGRADAELLRSIRVNVARTFGFPEGPRE
jgi:hypothetical protein